MHTQIDINVEDKIARLSDAACFIVCGNSDYILNFSFDEEWEAHEAKTARFVWGGQYVDVVFSGNQCPAPVILDTKIVEIGVFAGDLRTTTPAIIRCKNSIRCNSGAPKDPAPDVYDQIMQSINDGMLKGERGEKGEKGDKGEKGEKGDTGVIKTADMMGIAVNSNTGVAFIVPANAAQIDEKKASRLPITPENLDYAVKAGITTNTEKLTDEEKTAGCDWLGALSKPSTTGILWYDKNKNIVSTRSTYQGVPGNGQIPVAKSTGCITTNDPIDNLDCVNKQTLEREIAKLLARIEALGG